MLCKGFFRGGSIKLKYSLHHKILYSNYNLENPQVGQNYHKLHVPLITNIVFYNFIKKRHKLNEDTSGDSSEN